MNDLLNTGAANEPPVVVAFLKDTRSTSGRATMSRRATADRVWFVNSIARREDKKRLVPLWADGAAVVGDTFLSQENIASLDPAVLSLDRFWYEARGPLCIYAQDESTGSIWLFPDCLGSAAVFYYETENMVAASSSQRALVEVLESFGITLTKSPRFFLEMLAVESGGFSDPSSFNEIQAIPCFHAAEISSFGLEIREYGGVADFFHEQPSLEESVGRIANDYKSSAIAVANSGERNVAHLTAGADSRLSAAAVRATGTQGAFTFYCSSNRVTREGDIANRVASSLGLTMTKNQVVEPVRVPLGPLNEILASLSYSSGLKGTGPHSGYVRASGVTVSGIFGEQLRSYYSERFENGNISNAREFMNMVWAPALADPEIGIAARHQIDRIETAINRRMEHARMIGVREDAVGDFLFHTVRNRYFGAQTLVTTSRFTKQTSLVYSLHALRASLQLPIEQRRDGLLMYRVFEALDPACARLPFDTEKFGPSVRPFMTTTPAWPNKTTDEGPRFDSQPVREPYAVEYGPFVREKVAAAHVERARKIGGVKDWQVSSEGQARRFIKRSINFGSSIVNDTFRSDNLDALISRPANTKSRIRLVNRLAAYLAWYN